MAVKALAGWLDNRKREAASSPSHLLAVFISTGSHFTIESERSWMDAAINCMDKNSTLVEISDESMNAEIARQLSREKEAWIGLNRSLNWFWLETGEVSTFLNWQEGQPDNLKGDEVCVAMQMDDGTWSDEPCNMSYPFICKIGMKHKLIFLRLHIY